MGERGYYFAYGSNTNPARMRERGVKFFSYQRAILKDQRLVFNKLCRLYKGGFGCANIEPSKGEVVEGVLYEVDLEQALSKLDIFEGYPEHYIRKLIKVETPGGKTFKAIVYVAHPSKIEKGLKPHPDYLAHLLEACRLKLLSEKYCKRLKEIGQKIEIG